MNEAPHTAAPEATQPPPHAAAPNGADPETSPARALTLHLLRMLETRMDAAGIALSNEIQMFRSRIMLGLLAAAAMFIAIWGGIVLLAIALPEPYRVPVLAVVIALFAAGALWAFFASKGRIASAEVGSLRWFLDGLKLDLEVLSRSLHRRHETPPHQPPESVQ